MCCSLRDAMPSKTMASIQQLKIVELFGPVVLMLGEARRKEAFHTIKVPISHCDTFEVITLHNQCNFFLNACSEIQRISKQDVFPERSADKVMLSYFRHYCTKLLSNCCFPNFRKPL